MAADPPHPDDPVPPKHGATYWDELEASFADLEAGQHLHPGGIIRDPIPLYGGPEGGPELVLPLPPAGPRVVRVAAAPSWRILQPKTPGQRCACSAPPAPALPEARAVCPHGRAWRQGGSPVAGTPPLGWVELRGLARWWAARQARR